MWKWIKTVHGKRRKKALDQAVFINIVIITGIL